MVVNESFVRSHLDGMDPLGATVRTLEEPGFPEITYEIIGVVGDTKYADLRDENCWCQKAGESMAPIAYVPIAQNPSPYAWAPVIVRSRTPAAAIAGTIAQRVERLSPGIAMHVSELKTRVRERLLNERMVAWLAGAFAILAMALVIVGLVRHRRVSRREPEARNRHPSRPGLDARANRHAGASRQSVDDGGWNRIGLPLAVGAMRAARALLYGLSPTDSGMAAGATCLLAVAGVLAAAIPAWRAARVRLGDAMRSE